MRASTEGSGSSGWVSPRLCKVGSSTDHGVGVDTWHSQSKPERQALEEAIPVCADEVSDDATVEFGYGHAEDGAEDEEAGVSEEQECLARVNGGDDDPQEGPELLPERGREFRLSVLLLWVEGEEAGMRGKIRLRMDEERDRVSRGIVGRVRGGKKGGAEEEDGGKEEEEGPSGRKEPSEMVAVGLAKDL